MTVNSLRYSCLLYLNFLYKVGLIKRKQHSELHPYFYNELADINK